MVKRAFHNTFALAAIAALFPLFFELAATTSHASTQEIKRVFALNKPVSMLKTRRPQLMMILGSFIVLSGILVCLPLEIRRRRKAEGKLRERSRFIESIINLSPDVIYIYDLIDKKNLYSNDGIQQVLGYSAEDLQTMGSQMIAQLMHPDDLKVYVDKTIPRYACARDNEPIEHEYRMKHRDGQWRWLECKEIIYRRQSDSTPQQIFGVIHDVTGRKKEEAMMRQTLERLALAQQAAGAGMWSWDMATERLDGSPELSLLFGVDPALNTASFETWLDVIHPEDRMVAQERIAKAIRDHVLLKNEYRIVLPSGQVRWIQSLGNTTYDAMGKPLCMMGICIDITDRKQAEEEREKQTQELNTRNSDLTRINRLTVGRELRLIELKKEVDECCRRLGEPPRYPVSEGLAIPPLDSTEVR
ncbi:MAG: PAS domain-containing protein [Lentisphaerota bacterium]